MVSLAGNPDLKLAFFRPIASLLRYLDFATWGQSGWVPTSRRRSRTPRSRSWRRASTGGSSAARRRGLAALAFAVDDGHSMPIAWISARYGIFAALFGLGALLAHGRARADGRTPVLGPALMALALLSGETSLGILGYLAGYALFLDPKGRCAGVVALAPYAVLTATWAVAYRALGYGAAGSAFYVDPLASPRAFVAAASVRIPELVLSGILGPPAEVWGVLSPQASRVAAVAAVVVSTAVLFLVVRVARRAEGARPGVVPALLLGAAVALVPVAASMPEDRNFMIPGFGFFGVLALALTEVWRRREAHGRGTRAALGALAVVHLVVAPLLLPVRGPQSLAMLERTVARGVRQLPTGPRVEGKTFFFLGVPDPLMVGYMMTERGLVDGPKPKVEVILSIESAGTWTAEFTDEDTLVIGNPQGILHSFFAGLYTNKPFARGDVFDTDIERVEVLDLTPSGEPSAIRVTLRVPREQRIWLSFERGKGVVELPAPAPGARLSFEGFDLLALIEDGR